MNPQHRLRGQRALPRQLAGFTLVEVLIVTIVIVILTSMAIPAYSGYVERAQRATARSALTQLAQWMERVATATGSYPVCDASQTCTPALPAQLRQVEGGRYADIVVSNSTASSFTLTAAPTGAQLNDACQSFTLNHLGTRGVSATFTNAANECWNR